MIFLQKPKFVTHFFNFFIFLFFRTNIVFSGFLPRHIKWRLAWFNTKLSFHNIILLSSQYKICFISSNLWSEAYKVLYLRLDFVGKWNRSLRNILSKISPRIRPCGTQPTQNHKTTHSKRSHGNCKWTTYLNNLFGK